MAISPDSGKPKLERQAALDIIEKNFPDEMDKQQYVLFGLRGYYRKMGVPTENDRGIYDDYIAFVSKDGLYLPVNGNVDPSRHKAGMATLVAPQKVMYRVGVHGISHLNMSNAGDKAIYDKMLATKKDPTPIEGRFLPHWAFRQHGRVTVLRDGSSKPVTDTAEAPFYIDIHRGGNGTTSSLGCQTIYAPEWYDWFNPARAELEKVNQIDIPYFLVDAYA